MFGLGTPELIIILVIIVIFFGSSQIPKLARSIGKARRELKDGMNDKGDKQSTTENKDV